MIIPPQVAGGGPLREHSCSLRISNRRDFTGRLMSTLKKNKRAKRAKLERLYGDLKPGRGNKKVERGKAKYLGGNGRKTTGITGRTFKRNLQTVRVVENG